MTTTVASPLKPAPGDTEREERPTLGPGVARRTRAESDSPFFDATQGRKLGSDPYDDATQGRKLGSDPYDDATRGRPIGQFSSR